MPVRMLPQPPPPARTMWEIDALVNEGRKPLAKSERISRPRGDGNHPAIPPPREVPPLPEPLRSDAGEVELAEMSVIRKLDAGIWRKRYREAANRARTLMAEVERLNREIDNLKAELAAAK